MDKFQVTTNVHNGKIERQEYFNQCIQNFEGKEIVIKISKYSQNRSDRQNRYYWMYLKIIQDETGNDSLDMHEYFKRIFLPPVFITVFNKEIKIPASTTKLDKLQFTEYINKIELLSGIPSPNVDELYLT